MNSGQTGGQTSPGSPWPKADLSTPPAFREVQHFYKHWLFMLPIIAVTIIIWYTFYQQVILGNASGSRPIPNWLAWILTMVFGFGFPAFAYLFRLITEVRPGEIMVRLYPLRQNRVPTQLIVSGEVREYAAMREYGGWGVRTSKRSGRAITSFGNQGVQLTLQGGGLLLIGSQRPHELLTAIEAAGMAGSVAGRGRPALPDGEPAEPGDQEE